MNLVNLLLVDIGSRAENRRKRRLQKRGVHQQMNNDISAEQDAGQRMQPAQGEAVLVQKMRKTGARGVIACLGRMGGRHVVRPRGFVGRSVETKLASQYMDVRADHTH